MGSQIDPIRSAEGAARTLSEVEGEALRKTLLAAKHLCARVSARAQPKRDLGGTDAGTWRKLSEGDKSRRWRCRLGSIRFRSSPSLR